MEQNQDASTEELFEAFRSKGDSDALTTIFDRSAPKLLEVALHLCSDPCQAEDVMQETFLIAIEKANRWDAKRPLLPWLQGILVREARKARQRAKRASTKIEAPSERTDDAAAPLHEGELRESVESALTRISSTYVEILRRYLFDGKTASELATELDREPGTVRVQLHRGLDQLRRALPAGVAISVIGHGMPRGLAAIRDVVQQRAAQPAATAATGLVSLTLGVLLMNKFLVLSVVSILAALYGVMGPFSAELELEPNAGSSTKTVQLTSPEEEAEIEAATDSSPRTAMTTVADEPTKEASETRKVLLRGRVRLEDGGVPSGLRIVFVNVDREANTPVDSLTKAEVQRDGDFVITMDEPVYGTVTAAADGTNSVAVDPWSEVGAPQFGEFDLGELVLKEGATVMGWAYRDGELMTGGEVRAYLNVPRLDNSVVLITEENKHLEFATDGTIAPWTTFAEIRPDGQFQLRGLQTGQEYRLVATPEELLPKQFRALDPFGTRVQAPARGVVLDWGFRTVDFRVVSEGNPVAEPKLRPWCRLDDSRYVDSELHWFMFAPTIAGDAEGRIEALMPKEGSYRLQFIATGFEERVFDFDPSPALLGQETVVELEPQITKEMELIFTGVEAADLEGLQISGQMIDTLGFHRIEPVPVVDGKALIRGISPVTNWFVLELVAPEMGGTPASFLHFDSSLGEHILADSVEEEDNRRTHEVGLVVGGRIDLSCTVAEDEASAPEFQVLELDSRQPAKDIRGNDTSPSLPASRLKNFVWSPGWYRVRQTGSDHPEQSIDLQVFRGQMTRVEFPLSR